MHQHDRGDEEQGVSQQRGSAIARMWSLICTLPIEEAVFLRSNRHGAVAFNFARHDSQAETEEVVATVLPDS